MANEIGESELAGEDEGSDPRKQPKEKERAGDELDHAGEPDQRERRRRRHLSREAEELGKGVLKQEQRHHDAQDAQDLRRVWRKPKLTIFQCHHLILYLFIVPVIPAKAGIQSPIRNWQRQWVADFSVFVLS